MLDTHRQPCENATGDVYSRIMTGLNMQLFPIPLFPSATLHLLHLSYLSGQPFILLLKLLHNQCSAHMIAKYKSSLWQRYTAFTVAHIETCIVIVNVLK